MLGAPDDEADQINDPATEAAAARVVEALAQMKKRD
jgi:hypothetical protein